MSYTLHVRGKPGVLVPDPSALGINPPRFLGKALDPQKRDAPLLDRYRDVEAEVTDSAFCRDAVGAGHLEPLDDDTARRCGVRRTTKEP